MIAAHPKHRSGGYAPGELVSPSPGGNDKAKVAVRFYDFHDSLADRRNVFIIDHWKFHHDINSIKNAHRKIQVMQAFRDRLSYLDANERFVLAKWPDDGWYYPAVVRNQADGNTYVVERYPGTNLHSVKLIKREDILTKSEALGKETYVGNTVVARHPLFNFAYTPAEVARANFGNDPCKVVVRLSDLTEYEISSTDMFALDKTKFQYDMNSIRNLEERWLGAQNCLAYNFMTKQVEPAIITKRNRNNRVYDIVYTKTNTTASQYAYLIFLKDISPETLRLRSKSSNNIRETSVGVECGENRGLRVIADTAFDSLKQTFASAPLGNKLKSAKSGGEGSRERIHFSQRDKTDNSRARRAQSTNSNMDAPVLDAYEFSTDEIQ